MGGKAGTSLPTTGFFSLSLSLAIAKLKVRAVKEDAGSELTLTGPTAAGVKVAAVLVVVTVEAAAVVVVEVVAAEVVVETVLVIVTAGAVAGAHDAASGESSTICNEYSCSSASIG